MIGTKLKLHKVGIIILILKPQKLNSEIAQSYSAGKQWSQDSNPDNTTSEFGFLTNTPSFLSFKSHLSSKIPSFCKGRIRIELKTVGKSLVGLSESRGFKNKEEGARRACNKSAHLAE